MINAVLSALPGDISIAIHEALRAYAPHALGLGAPESLLGLGARFVVGFMFFWSGYTKLFRLDRREIMHQTLIEAGIPLPRLNTWFVSANELVFGFLFMLGAATLASGAILAAITLVAFVTVGRKKIEPGGPLFVLSGLLYNNEVMILVFIGLVAVYGPGPLSVDALVWPNLPL
jgi:uncharacterized membrane protein YphA (DoxX/SURF4 family)